MCEFYVSLLETYANDAPFYHGPSHSQSPFNASLGKCASPLFLIPGSHRHGNAQSITYDGEGKWIIAFIVILNKNRMITE